MENINEFNKAWKITCPKCVTNPNNILWFKNKCNNCITLENNNKKYTDEDMRECWRACLNFNKPAGLDSGINYSDFINSLNKQD